MSDGPWTVVRAPDPDHTAEVHVVRVSTARIHETSPTCWCQPRVVDEVLRMCDHRYHRVYTHKDGPQA